MISIYNFRKAVLEATCVSITQRQFGVLMKKAKRADRRKVILAAYLSGVIDEQTYKKELKCPYYNPYKHFRTDKHLVYVNSAIEHFICVS